jgi:hypothetical protein
MQKAGLFETGGAPGEKWEFMQEYMMAPGARPVPGVITL